MIPPDAGREPRTDSPKFRRVATGDLISQKSQQGKEKVALCQLLWDKVGLATSAVLGNALTSPGKIIDPTKHNNRAQGRVTAPNQTTHHSWGDGS